MTVAMLLPNILRDAGWSAPFASASPVKGCNGTGIWVQVSPRASAHTRDAASIIVASLKALPMIAAAIADLRPDEMPEDVDTVVITVESHPL